jgi:hypothetical protein
MGDKSGDLAGHATGSLLPIHMAGNVSRNCLTGKPNMVVLNLVAIWPMDSVPQQNV